MYNQKHRHYNTKFLFLRLMMKNQHTKERTKGTAHGCQHQQPGFRYTPFVLSGFDFVKAVDTEGYKIDYNQVQEQNLLPKRSWFRLL